MQIDRRYSRSGYFCLTINDLPDEFDGNLLLDYILDADIKIREAEYGKVVSQEDVDKVLEQVIMEVKEIKGRCPNHKVGDTIVINRQTIPLDLMNCASGSFCYHALAGLYGQVMLIRGGRDEWVPAFNADRLYEAAGEPKALYLVPNAGHGGLLEADPAEFEARMVDFLDAYLRKR